MGLDDPADQRRDDRLFFAGSCVPACGSHLRMVAYCCCCSVRCKRRSSSRTRFCNVFTCSCSTSTCCCNASTKSATGSGPTAHKRRISSLSGSHPRPSNHLLRARAGGATAQFPGYLPYVLIPKGGDNVWCSPGRRGQTAERALSTKQTATFTSPPPVPTKIRPALGFSCRVVPAKPAWGTAVKQERSNRKPESCG